MDKGDKMKAGDLVKVGHIGFGIVTAVYWDEEDSEDVIRVQYTDGTWSLESESIVEVLNASR
jgi:hypothetical protein